MGTNSRQPARANSRRRTSPQLPRASTRQTPEIIIEFRNNGGGQWQNTDVNSRFDKGNLDSRSQSRTGNRMDVAPSKDRWNNNRIPQSNGQSRNRLGNGRFSPNNGQSRDRLNNDKFSQSNGQSRDRFRNDRFSQSNGQSRDRFNNDRFPQNNGQFQSIDRFNNDRVGQNNIGSHNLRQNTNQNNAFVDSHHGNIHDLSADMSLQNHQQTHPNIAHDLHQPISDNHHLSSHSNKHHVTANNIAFGASNRPQNGNLGSGPRNVNINSEILGLVNAVPLDQTVNHQTGQLSNSLSPSTALKPGTQGHTRQHVGLVGHSAVNTGTHGNIGLSGLNEVHSGINTHNLLNANGVNLGPHGNGVATSGLPDLSAATSGHNVGLHTNSLVGDVLGKQASNHGLNNVNGLSTGTLSQGTNLGSSLSNQQVQNSHNQMVNGLSNAMASNQMLDLGNQQNQFSAVLGQANSQQNHHLAAHLSNSVGQINTSLVTASTSTRNNGGNGSAGFPGANNIDLNNTIQSLNNIIASNASPGLSPVASNKIAAAHAHNMAGSVVHHPVPAVVRPRIEPIEIDYEEILQRAMTNRILNGLIL